MQTHVNTEPTDPPSCSSSVISFSLVGLRATHKNRHHGRHQEEDAGDEAGEGQRYGQGRHPGAAEQGGQPQGGEGNIVAILSRSSHSL